MTATIISKTDLARRTREVVDQARRGDPIIVESYGQEQVAILDAIDYRCLQALATVRLHASLPDSTDDPGLMPAGLTVSDVEQAQSLADGDVQAAWNLVIAAYVNGAISLGRAAELLHLSRFELQYRLNRLGQPLRIGAVDIDEALSEAAALR